MRNSDTLFLGWWSGVCFILAAATWQSMHRHEPVELDHVLRVLLVGIAAGLALYVLPSGFGSIRTAQDFELRFFAGLGVAWLVTMRIAGVRRSEEGASSLALAGFIGISIPPLALLASVMMICGGQTSCL